jgi:hypothetical protein
MEHKMKNDKRKNIDEDIQEPNPLDADSEDNITGFGGFGKTEFSKPALVMTALLNCSASANCEMRSGYTIRKVDANGNVNETYVEDGRKKHISNIEFLGEILSPELDEPAEKNISELFESIETKKKYFIEKEIETWRTMPFVPKRQLTSGKDAIYPLSGFITLPFYQDLMTEFQLEIYKTIFVELNHLLARIKYFKKKAQVG